VLLARSVYATSLAPFKDGGQLRAFLIVLKLIKDIFNLISVAER
jgi:hypothetical protein